MNSHNSSKSSDLHDIERDPDVASMQKWMEIDRVDGSVAQFTPGGGIERLQLRFDIDKLRQGLDAILAITDYQGDMLQEGFGAIALNRRPGVDVPTANDLSGRYWLRADDRYVEEPREELVDESLFTEIDPRFANTYFAYVDQELRKRFPIGRMRILSKGLFNCNSWHRDPEPRLHIPITTNPGSLFIVNHHVTHLPADGSVYFTDTRGYHTALNGGEYHRVHLVAALAF